MRQDFSIGIDFGTTKSALGYINYSASDGRMLPNPSAVAVFGDQEFMPSQIYIDTSGSRKVGMDAQTVVEDRDFDDERLFSHFKLDLGKPPTALDERYSRFRVNPVRLASLVINELRVLAEGRELSAGEPLRHATVTIPSSWSEEQKNETKLAVLGAGFESADLIREPYAALISLRPDRRDDANDTKTYAVFDYGGGTCDVAICTTHPGTLLAKEPEITEFTLRNCGGTRIDEFLTDYLIGIAQNKWGFNVARLPGGKQYRCKILRRVELAKQYFCSRSWRQVKSSFSFAIPHPDGGPSFHKELSEAELEHVIRRPVDDAVGALRGAITKAKLDIEQIDKVYLLGGSSMLPLTRKLVAGLIPETRIEMPERPRHHVVYGAALWSYLNHYKRKPKLLGTKGITEATLSRYSTLWLQLVGNDYEMLVEKGTPLDKAGQIRKKSFRVPRDGMTEIRFNVLEGDKAALNTYSKTQYAERAMPLPTGVRKGTKVTIEYYVNMQDLLVLKAWLDGDQKKEMRIVGGSPITKEGIMDLRSFVKGNKS